MSTTQTPPADVTITKATRERLKRVADPTRTTTVRQRFQQQANTRWRAVRGDIRETVENNDAFDLRETTPDTYGLAPRGWRGTSMPTGGTTTRAVVSTQTRTGDPAGRLRVDSLGSLREDPAAAQAAFEEWLDTVLATRLGTDIPGGRAGAADGRAWHAEYIRHAYIRGIALANADLRAAGRDIDPDDDPLSTNGASDADRMYVNQGDERVDPTDAVNTPQHRRALREEYLATQTDVKAAADATRTNISRELRTHSQDPDITPAVLAGPLTSRTDAVGQTRTAVVANTRVVATTNRAIVEQADLLGAEMLGVIPESDPHGERTDAVWATAGDDRVCALCASMEGMTAAVADVKRGDVDRPVYDTHPQCRCRWIILR